MAPSQESTAKKSATKKTKAHKTSEKRTILSPAVRSRHHEAIKEAVEKVFANREAACKGSL